MDPAAQTLLKHIPKVDRILQLLEERNIYQGAPKNVVKEMCRLELERLRRQIMNAGEPTHFQMPTDEQVAGTINALIEDLHKYSLRRVVNATGIILHTNLGRAPLTDAAVERVADIGGAYSNLEFNLETGQRGLRYDHVQKILCLLSGAEDALVVNNNAAAVLLVLNTVSDRKEAVVSRGELIEIGGEFRIPEIMQKSGAILREVGTTNRTHLEDYEKAVNEETGVILKVHTSNYKIVGFTEEIDLSTLVQVGKRFKVPVFNDLGSGCFLELDRFGLAREPTVQDAVAAGADVVTLSGDKLLGGPQAGIILGKKAVLERIKKNPLNRALRIDKLTLAALEATLMQYLNVETAVPHSRILKSLTEPEGQVAKRAGMLIRKIRRLSIPGLTAVLRKGISRAGGGSLPMVDIPTSLVAVKLDGLSCNAMEERLRHLPVPIVARIADEELLMDLRTISEQEYPFILEALKTFRQETLRET